MTFRYLALLTLLIVPAPAARPHVLAVAVADVNSGQPLTGAQVRVPALGLMRRAAEMGRAVFPDVAEGRVHVEARMIGYAPIDADVLVRAADDTVEVVLLMQPRTPTMDTVRTTATRLKTRAASEIASRERIGIGRFLTDSVLRR